MQDQLTTDIAAFWIAKFDAAVQAEDFAEMQRVVATVEASPNRPFKREVLRQIAASEA
jgi:hypothetical protein